MADWTDAAVEAIAAWHSRWCGASSIRKRDRAYAREVLSVLSAAGREEPTLWAVVEVDPETGRPTSPEPEGWADSLAEAQSLAAEQTAWAEKHHMPGGPFRVFELRPVIAKEGCTDGRDQG